MTIWYKNYLGDSTQPWARQVQKEIDNQKAAFQTAEVNNVKRDAQLQSSLRQVQASTAAASQAAIDAAGAAQDAADAAAAAASANATAISANTTAINANSNALSAIQDIIDLGSTGGPTINAGNVRAGTMSADRISGGTIDGITINGGSLNTTSSGGRSVTISGSSAFFKYNGGSVGEVTSDSAGRLLVSGNSGLYLNGGASGSTHFGSGGFTVGDSATFTVQGNSDLRGRIISDGTYNAVASSSANLIINSNYLFQRTTSSRRYKSDIQDIDYGLKGLELQPRSWVDKAAYQDNGNSSDGLTRITGFIAEEIHDLGLTELVQYNEDGLPEAVNYDRITVALMPVLKQQQALIESLTARIQALENKVQ